jgi:hypothetical protein
MNRLNQTEPATFYNFAVLGSVFLYLKLDKAGNYTALSAVLRPLHLLFCLKKTTSKQ